MSRTLSDFSGESRSHTLRRARTLLGTVVDITARGESAQAAGAAVEQAFAAIERVQALMSYHDPASDVSRLNRLGVGCIAVDPLTWQVLDTARAISEASRGRFDISIAPELVRHGYLPDHTDFAQPAAEANWQHITPLPDHCVRFDHALHLDLGGIAKGFAVDCAIRALQDAGLRYGRVNAGGDLRLFGNCAEAIHVRHPLTATRLLPLCELDNGAVATSAPYYTARQLNGQTISPLIDARTRQACIDVRSVSVLADECVLADALTKVVYAAPDQSLAVLERFGAHAVILDADANAPGGCRVRLSGPAGWRDAPSHEPEAVAA